MKPFAELLDRLAFTPGRNAKLRLMQEYFLETPDPDRGWALAALTGTLPFSFPVRRVLTELISARIDPELYRMSRDYVGDTAETAALLWPEPHRNNGPGGEPPPSLPLSLSEVAETLLLLDRNQVGAQLAQWLDRLDVAGRWALLKLLTGGLRVGVSARLAKTAVAGAWSRPVEPVEEVWHALSPPYVDLFAWLTGDAELPDVAGLPVFRPMMLAHPLEEKDRTKLAIAEFAVEWKWDGVRVQICSRPESTRIFSRTGDEISAAFPDLMQDTYGNVTLDGELLVVRDGEVASFNDLQQRLNRKSVEKKRVERFPAYVRLYDILDRDGVDLRALPFIERRQHLEAWFREQRPLRCDLSQLVTGFADLGQLREIWSQTRAKGIEGLMLKRRSSRYLPGRPKGQWFKWKRAPLTADCVLMYAQRGSGKRSSYYSDYTFGVWTQDPGGELKLVPVGKAYSGFTDEELRRLDRWIRDNTRETFGPVRSLAPELVLEVAFDAIQPSSRHKSGLAMRFPRIHRIRWDKPAREADQLETIRALADA